MVCYHPLKAWWSRDLSSKGKPYPVFSPSRGYVDKPLELPCGQCVGCRLDYSRQWAVRCMHEASLHEDNCFITLTFNDEHLPDNWSLNKRDYQLFMKRLRKRFPGKKIRYYHCGEYGDKSGRPHYHSLLFGFDFPDKQLFKINRNGDRIYVSEILSELWPFGFSTIGNVTFDSAAYVARYVLKKRTGNAAKYAYEWVDIETGEIIEIQPEYCTMSRRPGIAREWFEKYKNDVYPNDLVVSRGRAMRPPKYYDSLYEIENPDLMECVKKKRLQQMKKHLDNLTEDRLNVREQVKLARIKLLKRSLD